MSFVRSFTSDAVSTFELVPLKNALDQADFLPAGTVIPKANPWVHFGDGKNVIEMRWLLQREDSPWYPSMRLFRQRQAGDWPGVVDQVIAGAQTSSGSNATPMPI